ncbi:MAG: glutathione-dependent reductase [endosymbiont of Galathealinum brachiosum]|uniref:Glutathione-dependent reductase n=1 Tax=endosymbiont of Galathealinum brachiosum TaxID=2200906 RepID=A0A370DL73_9GAMM|nr:MAG: glutathione-dependent reductase [endosymbiont of Galathealinum brachiosum]
MGMLIKGELVDNWLEKEIDDGEFKRMESTFRHSVKADGSSEFAAEADRYHLYVSNACPWAHRTVIFRKLKKLEKIIGLSVVEADMFDDGWTFEKKGQYCDDLYGFRHMHEIYTCADKEFTGQITVPVLWDKKLKTIVNNESSEIIRMLNKEFNEFTDVKTDFYPAELRERIDAINQPVYDNINNGVYRCGFATSQEAYEKAFDRLFNELNNVEKILQKQRYLTGNEITEADWRLFTTLIRFDAVYVGHFKCNLKRIADYPELSNYLRELYQVEGIAETVDFEYIKRHYYYSHTSVNPTQLVPKGPELNFTEPHNRGDKFGE